jgi:hypothetical protein
MPFAAYLPRSFEHAHENDSFDILVNCLKAHFDPRPGLHVLIGNVMFEGKEMDAVFFKPDGVAVIEMKNHGGKVLFNENTAWTAGGVPVIGGVNANPFIQARGYRIVLGRYLETRSNRFLLAPRDIFWRDVSAIVLFARTIEFDNNSLGELGLWFQVTDMARIAQTLSKVHARSITFRPDELRLLLGLLGITDAHRYRLPVPTDTTPLEASPAPAPDAIQLNYVKEFKFRDNEQRMRNMGAARAMGAETVGELFEQVRQGMNPFATMAKRPDARIKGATIYLINSSCELLLIQLGTFAIPAFIGDPRDVDGWINAHPGLTVSVDELTGRVSITSITTKPETTPLQAPALTTENKPFLTRLAGLDLEKLVPQELAREHLLSLDETSTESDIRKALQLVFSDDVRSFIFDLIRVLSAGDIPAAEARLRLRNGQAVPAQDAGQFADAAAAAPINSDQVLVINQLSKEELERLLDPVNFQDWMLFLHPDQKALADTEFDRPVILKGVSGSGKTCILVHRARMLAKKYPGERIGILTLSTSLSGLLRNLVSKLCSVEERRNIVVLPFYEVFRDCLKHLAPEKYFSQLRTLVDPGVHIHTILDRVQQRWPDGMVWDLDPVSKVTVGEEWNEFYMSRNPTHMEWMNPIVKYLEAQAVDASRYIEEEFTLIRSAFPVPSRSEYLSEDTIEQKFRAGRSIPFTREKQRPDLLRLLLFWEEWLLEGGMIDALGLTQALMPLHGEMQRLPDTLKFRCLLVDEFQDFSSLDLQLLRRVVPLEKPDSLFIAGDPVQKILVKRLRYADAGLDSGPAIHKKIHKNYRNSKQILRAASRVANHFGKVAGSQGEDVEVLDPELAERETNPPIALKTDSQIQKAWEIALECTRTDKADPYTVCIATAAPQSHSVQNILDARPQDIKARALSGDCILHTDEVVVGTINELKGFEFRLILIVGCDAKFFPDPGIPHDEVWREALRLYVAMTRGRDQVFLLFEQHRSEFITVMGDAVVEREEPVLKPYERHQPMPATQPEPPAPPITGVPQPVVTRPAGTQRVRPHPAAISGSAVDWNESCDSWFSEIEKEALNRYFARYVYRDGLTFREWLRPRGLKMIQPRLFYGMHRCLPTVVSRILYKLSEKGLRPLSRNDMQ